MTSADTSTDSTTALSFPLQLRTHAIDAGSIVIEADLSEGTLALLAGAGDIEISIDTPQSYEDAADELAKIKAVAKRIDEQRKAITKPLDDEKKRVMDHVRPFTDALARVEASLKNGLIAFDQEQERKRKLAEAEAAEKARKEAEKLERQAEKAEAAGRTEKADALREQATTAVFAAPAPAVTETPKVSGLSTRKTYGVEVTDLMALVKAVASGAAPLKLLQADTKVLGQMATALKEDFSYPGVKLVVSTGIASRSKR